MCSNAGNAQLVGCLTPLSWFEEEVDTSVGAVHVPGTILELSGTADLLRKVVE
jgi:hypothetical protein